MNQYEIIRLTTDEMNFYEQYSQHRKFLNEMKFLDETGGNFIEKYNKSIDKSNFYIVIIDKREFQKQMIDEDMEYELEEIGSDKIGKLLNKRIVGVAEYEYIGKYPGIELKREYYTIHKDYQKQGLSRLFVNENNKIIDKFIKDEEKKGNLKTTIFFPELDSFSVKGFLGTKKDTLTTILSLATKYPHIEKELLKHYKKEELEAEIETIDKTKAFVEDLTFIGRKKDYKKVTDAGLDKLIFKETVKIDDNAAIEEKITKILENNPELKDKKFLYHYNSIIDKTTKEELFFGESIKTKGKELLLRENLIIYNKGKFEIYNFDSELQLYKNIDEIELNIENIEENYKLKDKFKLIDLKELEIDQTETGMSGVLKKFINNINKNDNYKELRLEKHMFNSHDYCTK